jgi:YidC/Oxa1 family membrane protein insertase
MDRRTAVAVLMSLLLFWSWSSSQRAAAELEARAAAEQAAGTAPEAGASAAPVAPEAPPPPVSAPLASAPVQDLDVAGCGTRGVLSTRGPSLRAMHHDDWPAPYRVEPIWIWAFGLLSGSPGAFDPYGSDPGAVELLSDHAAGLSAGVGAFKPLTYAVVDAAEGTALTATGVQGVRVDWSLRAVPGDVCTFELVTRFTNTGTTPFDGPAWVAAHDAVQDAPSMLSGYVPVRGPVAYVDGDVLLGDGAAVAAEAEDHEGVVGWFGLADTYFGTILIPESGGPVGAVRFDGTPAVATGARWVAQLALAPGASSEARFRVYSGPLSTDALQLVDPTLPDLVQFGWFAVFAWPLKLGLVWFHAAVGNWGVAIALLTLLIKLVLFPLTQSAFRSGQAMAALQPQLAALRETYKDDANQLNLKTMEVFRTNGVNPFGGCLPMIVQMPIWIALYNVLRNVVELYHTEFLYLRDLSSLDPFGVLPTLVIGLMWMQQQLTPMTNLEPAQQQVMKWMPVIVGVFFYGLPSGLMIYIFVNTALSILQQWYIKKQFEAASVAAT